MPEILALMKSEVGSVPKAQRSVELALLQLAINRKKASTQKSHFGVFDVLRMSPRAQQVHSRSWGEGDPSVDEHCAS